MTRGRGRLGSRVTSTFQDADVTRL